MPKWLRQLLPFLLLLSLTGNLYLTWQLYDQGRTINQVTWVGDVNEALKYLAWDRVDLTPSPEGRLPAGSGTPGVWLALEEVKELRHLPHYTRRVDDADMRTVIQFLAYAGQVVDLARKEERDRGSLSPETRKLLTSVTDGLGLILSHHGAFNKAGESINPWNHEAWLKIWREMAAGLRAMEFAPLPQ